MNPEEREMLERILRLTENTNKAVRAMRREVIWGRIVHMLYWIVIIGIAVASYYYIKPYLGNLNGALDLARQYYEEQLK